MNLHGFGPCIYPVSIASRASEISLTIDHDVSDPKSVRGELEARQTRVNSKRFVSGESINRLKGVMTEVSQNPALKRKSALSQSLAQTVRLSNTSRSYWKIKGIPLRNSVANFN